jgi:hypothetical protein
LRCPYGDKQREPSGKRCHSLQRKNAADAWVVRDQYRTLMLPFLVRLPLFLIWVMAWLPRLTGGKGQIPDHEYWLQMSDEAKRRASC